MGAGVRVPAPTTKAPTGKNGENMEYAIGDKVVITEVTHGNALSGYGDHRIQAGMIGNITRLATHKVVVRFTGAPESNFYGSFWIHRQFIAPADPNRPRPRKLGDVPEGGIDPNDPRLAWLWEDAAAYAGMNGYCSTYDSICETLGIPGRDRTYTASVRVGSATIRAQFTCKSRAEAHRLMVEDLAKNGITLPQSATIGVES